MPRSKPGRSLIAQISLFLLCGYCAHLVHSAPTSAAKVAAKNAFRSSPKLFMDAEGKTGNSASANVGTWNILSDEFNHEIRADPLFPKETTPIRGLKHVFKVFNASDTPVTIHNYTSDCSCIDAVALDGYAIIQWPYVVRPRESILILARIDTDIIAPGDIVSTVNLVDEKSRNLASFTLSCRLVGPAQFYPSRIKFTDSKFGPKSAIPFRLRIDRRVRSSLPDRSLEVVSPSPDFRVSYLTGNASEMGVRVSGGKIELPEDPDSAEFRKDLDLHFQLTRIANAPIGPRTGTVDLRVANFPDYMLFRSSVLSYESTVTGNMSAGNRNSVYLGRVKRGHEALAPVTISLTTPVSPGNLVVTTSPQNLMVRVAPTPREPNPVKSKGATSVTLFLGVSSTTQAGPFSGQITVSNKVNEQKIVLAVSASVQG